MQYFRLVAAIGVILFLFTAVMPWLTINIPMFGQFTVTMADIYRIFMQQRQPQPMQASPTEQVTNMVSSVLFMLASIILFPISALLGLVSILARRVALAAGLLAMFASIFWIAGIESLKSQIVEQASGGGVFGGLLASMLVAAIQVGYGVYIAVFASIVMFVAFFIKTGGRQYAPIRARAESWGSMQATIESSRLANAVTARPARPAQRVRVEVVARGNSIVCRRCGRESPLTSNSCTSCGAAFQKATYGLRCPACSAPLKIAKRISADRFVCTQCFSDLRVYLAS